MKKMSDNKTVTDTMGKLHMNDLWWRPLLLFYLLQAPNYHQLIVEVNIEIILKMFWWNLEETS